MKKYLLPENGNFYKANLHCHTTVSDGKLTPEQVKEEYIKKGYSVIAYTDHDIMIPHDELDSENFLALHGYEMEMPDRTTELAKARKTCHICLIATDPENLKQVCWHREKYLFGHAPEYKHLVKFDESLPDFERSYTTECVNEIIKTAKKNGFFVTYNHPSWSLENFDIVSQYEGMDAMEICNYSSYTAGYPEYNPKMYEDLLRVGKRIYCIGADDNHNGRPVGDPKCDSFGAWTVIKAEKLEYKAITDALLAGNFYASQGPEIKALWIEDGKLCVETSPCERISMLTGTRKLRASFRQKGKKLTRAEFPVEADDIFVRVNVMDKQGKCADSNAYFCDEIFKEEN